MQAAEAIEFAKHVEPRMVASATEIERQVLNAVFNACPAKVKAKVLKTLLDRAEQWRNPDACVSSAAHAIWYPHYLQVAARAAQMINPLSPEPPK